MIKQFSIVKIIIVSLLALWAIIELYPILFMFNTSLKLDPEILNSPFSIGFPPSFESYARVWEGDQTGQPFISYFLNSGFILVGTILLLLVTSTLAGYALARGRFPGSPVVQQGFLLSLAVPAHALLIPLYFFLGNLGLRNNLLGMVLIYTTLGLPLSIALARAYFLSFPIELEEQALIDGCSRAGAFWRIVVPMSRSILATIAIVNVTWVWSELFFAQAFLSDTDVQTLPIAVASYRPAQMQASAAISQHFAIMALTTLPLVIFYFVFQSHIRKGMTAGALR
jgi:ABC-type glycerol-3-phosphate transport system permease component